MIRSRPIVYAHRGASHELPENTIEAFGLAIELGADAIETDAHLTRDGRIVLSHDPSGARMAGVHKAIRDATLAEVRGWDVGARFTGRSVKGAFRVPTLEEALEALPDVVFNVDAKALGMVPALVRAIRDVRATDRVRIASFSARNLRVARALGYEGETGLATGEVARAMLLPRVVGKRVVRGDAAQVPLSAYGIRFDTQRAIDRLHALGLRVDFWTVDDAAIAKRLFALGADGVMTNDPRAVCVRA
ncbi:MAG TPA: glycerophosphodiester phosphodiesterase family protein [Labilithrix sp.]